MYRVKIEQFEGPLDLLLEIIEAKKLPLHEISLAEIADQFLAYTKSLKERSIEELVGFLVVASRLALLKSRELVPQESEDNEADGSIEKLQKQLAFYQVFRNGAKLLKKREKEDKSLYCRESFATQERIFYFPKNLEMTDLKNTLEDLLGSITLPKKIPQAQIKNIISIEQCIKDLLKVLKSQKNLKLQVILKNREPEERLAHFLGALELVRQNKVKARQKANFGTITLASV